MATELTVIDPSALALAGQAANHAAAANVIQDYRSHRTPQTLRRQDADLALFERYLRSAGLDIGDLASRPECWHQTLDVRTWEEVPPPEPKGQSPL